VYFFRYLCNLSQFVEGRFLPPHHQRSFTLRNALARRIVRIVAPGVQLHAARAHLIPFPLVLVVYKVPDCTWYTTIQDTRNQFHGEWSRSWCTRIALDVPSHLADALKTHPRARWARVRRTTYPKTIETVRRLSFTGIYIADVKCTRVYRLCNSYLRLKMHIRIKFYFPK